MRTSIQENRELSDQGKNAKHVVFFWSGGISPDQHAFPS